MISWRGFTYESQVRNPFLVEQEDEHAEIALASNGSRLTKIKRARYNSIRESQELSDAEPNGPAIGTKATDVSHEATCTHSASNDGEIESDISETAVSIEMSEEWKARLLDTHARLMQRKKQAKIDTSMTIQQRISMLEEELQHTYDLEMVKLKAQDDTS